MALVVLPLPFAARIAYGYLHDYQRARIETFMNPESDPAGRRLQHPAIQDCARLRRYVGKGYLQGTQGHLNFLPEKQTDFIFTMFAEEFGFVGCLVVMALLLLIVLGAMAIGAADPPSVRPGWWRSGSR